jgi:TolB-like protein/Tfp pilus assembly protein PilF
MAVDPNKFSRLWQELKRRRVVHVLIVYVTASLVIIELVNNITEPLNLPAWMPTFAIIVLAIGFPIALIFSWIFDVTPQGIEKTGPAKKSGKQDNTVVPNSWRIATYVSLVVIVVLIVLNILPRTNRSGKKELLDKSIAVLPFINDSPDEEKMYFINGTMEAILDNLSKISDLRVVSRTSVEQYRNNIIPIPVVAKEMNVSYVLEGSGHRDGDQVRLYVQLLDGRKDQHLWSKSYDADIKEIFSLQSEIAQLVAEEIKAIISPEEKELIDKVPTSSLTAYDLYQKGLEAQRIFESNHNNREALARAETLYRTSLQYDSTFARAYLGLANLFYMKYGMDPDLYETFKDSTLDYINTAIGFDNQLADAYNFKGYFYRLINEPDLAVREWERAISLNPNSAAPYTGLGWQYFSEGDYVKTIGNFAKATTLERGPDLPGLLRDLGFGLTSIGFYKESVDQYREALRLDDDSAEHFQRMAYVELCAGHNEKVIEAGLEAIEKDPQRLNAWNYTGEAYIKLGQYEKALPYYQTYAERLESRGGRNLYSIPWMAYVYLKNGDTAKADYYISEQISFANLWIERGISGYESNYMRLAQVYAMKGERENTLANLKLYDQHGITSVHDHLSSSYPMFEPFKDDPGVRQIMDHLEAQYQAEHARVAKWLKQNDML